MHTISHAFSNKTLCGTHEPLTAPLTIDTDGWYLFRLAFRNEYGKRAVLQLSNDDTCYGPVILPEASGETTLSPLTIFLKAGTHVIRLLAQEEQADILSVTLIPSAEPDTASPSFRCNNKKASKECLQLMEYLKSIYGKKILTGQQTTFAKGSEIKTIEKITGCRPALRGFDLMSYSLATDTLEQTPHCQEELASNPGSIEAAIQWAKEEHGLVSFCWHWFSPIRAKNKSFYTEDTPFDVTKAVLPGTPEHDAALQDIDAIALQLKRLEAQDIPVLWRPLHEASGGWFWWGAKTADAYKKLYIMMYERLTCHHQLNNLIWVWNSPEAGWYPGDEYVDILSTDIYASSHDYGPLATAFAHTLSFSPEKPAALGENGPIPDPDLLTASKTAWLWFLTWGGPFIESEDYSTAAHISKVYNSDYAVTLEELPDIFSTK